MPPTQSAVDEAVKIPMLSDAMRVVSSLYGLGDGEGMPSGSGGWSALPDISNAPTPLPRAGASAARAGRTVKGIAGTAFREVAAAE